MRTCPLAKRVPGESAGEKYFRAQQQENCEAHGACQAVVHWAEHDFFGEAVNPHDWQQAGEAQPARGVQPGVVELPIQPGADGQERGEAENRRDGELSDWAATRIPSRSRN